MGLNPGAALGQEVGKMIEGQIAQAVASIARPRGFTISPKRLRNGQGNEFQIDIVVSDQEGNPIVIVDPKYIRYHCIQP